MLNMNEWAVGRNLRTGKDGWFPLSVFHEDLAEPISVNVSCDIPEPSTFSEISRMTPSSTISKVSPGSPLRTLETIHSVSSDQSHSFDSSTISLTENGEVKSSRSSIDDIENIPSEHKLIVTNEVDHGSSPRSESTSSDPVVSLDSFKVGPATSDTPPGYEDASKTEKSQVNTSDTGMEDGPNAQEMVSSNSSELENSTSDPVLNVSDYIDRKGKKPSTEVIVSTNDPNTDDDTTVHAPRHNQKIEDEKILARQLNSGEGSSSDFQEYLLRENGHSSLPTDIPDITRVRALHDFLASREGELTVRKSDLISIEICEDGLGWGFNSSSNECGWYPLSIFGPEYGNAILFSVSLL
jgi:hypothetical protein